MVEIRSLCQRLEESICTNDRFREQLERCLAFTGKASGTVLQGGQGRRGPLRSGGGPSLRTPHCRGAHPPRAQQGVRRETQHRAPLQDCPAMSMPRGPSQGCS